MCAQRGSVGRAGTLASPPWGRLASPPWTMQLDGSQGARRGRCKRWPRSQLAGAGMPSRGGCGPGMPGREGLPWAFRTREVISSLRCTDGASGPNSTCAPGSILTQALRHHPTCSFRVAARNTFLPIRELPAGLALCAEAPPPSSLVPPGPGARDGSAEVLPGSFRPLKWISRGSSSLNFPPPPPPLYSEAPKSAAAPRISDKTLSV